MTGGGAILLGLYTLLLLAAAAQDLRSLRIRNVFPLAILGVAAVKAIIMPGGNPAWEYLVSFALVFAAGVILFRLGWFGGGDAKLFAASAAWFDLSMLMPFVATVLTGGALLTIILLGARVFAAPARGRQRQRKWLGLERGRLVPYGVAIAAGAIIVAWLSLPKEAFVLPAL